MSEMREVIARTLCPRAWVKGYELPQLQRTSLRDADAALRALSEAGRTYEQGVKDGREQLEEHHLDALTTMSQLNRDCVKRDDKIAALSAQLAQAREALKRLASSEAFKHSRTLDKHRDAELIARMDFAEATLAALTAGSTEGKDG